MKEEEKKRRCRAASSLGGIPLAFPPNVGVLPEGEKYRSRDKTKGRV